MPRRTRFFVLVGAAMILFGVGLVFGSPPITVSVDGQAHSVRALTARGALRALGISLAPEDVIDPAPDALLAPGSAVTVQRSRPVIVIYQGIPIRFASVARTPTELLAQAGVPFTPGDAVWLDGQPFPPDLSLPPLPQYTLQYRPAVDIVLKIDDAQAQTLRSTAATLGAALWEAGIALGPGDRLDPPADTLLAGPLAAHLRRAARLVIQSGDQRITTHTAAATVGQALAEAGLALVGLDYSIPAETRPLAEAGGQVRVVRVREEIRLTQTTIPFEVQKKQDADTDLDTQRVIEPGQVGLKVTRERVRFEDEAEVARAQEAEWTASEPKAQVIGLGTKAVVQTLDTPDGPIEYYRAVNVYATSYSPCQQGLGRCSRSTSSGIPLAKGVVAVTLAWYNQFAGQRVYIPGYGVGVIGDVGGGVPGQYWIDLGYSDEDFVAWHENVTIYFLTPVPASVPWTLP